MIVETQVYQYEELCIATCTKLKGLSTEPLHVPVITAMLND